jgi:hypothetical protein
MDTTTSSIFSEIYLKYVENTKIIDALLKNKLIEHFQHVDNLLILYNTDLTNIHDVLNSFNSVMPTMNFTIKEEVNNTINFLDITISTENNNVSFDIQQKPTATDTTITQDSCHPTEHKLADIRYLVNINETYVLKKTLNRKKMK